MYEKGEKGKRCGVAAWNLKKPKRHWGDYIAVQGVALPFFLCVYIHLYVTFIIYKQAFDGPPVL